MNLGPQSSGPPPLPIYQPKSRPAPPRLSQELAWMASLLFLAIALLLLLLGQSPAWSGLVGNMTINFLAIIIEALPFMLIGTLVGGLIEVFISSGWVERAVRRRRILAVFMAGAMGLLFPVCECAIVPVVRRLLGKGVPLAAALTFLLAGPIVNPIVVVSTAIAYGYDWLVPLIRLGCGYGIAVTVGLVLGRWFDRDNGLLPQWSSSLTNTCGHQGCAHHDAGQNLTLFARLRHALEHACDDFFGVGIYLVLGAFIAAFIRSIVPMDVFSSLHVNPWQPILMMMVMAVLLNLCSEADAFIAASFRDILPGSAQLAFMVLGPMLDLKLLLMYASVFRNRLIVTLAASVVVGVFLTMIGLQYLAPRLF